MRNLYSKFLFLAFKLKVRKSAKLKLTKEERLGRGGWLNLTQEHQLWIHAASVGELSGIKLLINELQKRNFKLLITSTSNTGNEYAKKINPTGTNLILPLDTKEIISKIVSEVKPRLLLLVETEVWPNLIFEVAANGGKIIGINSRISDFAFPKYRRFKFLLKSVFKKYDLILAQQNIDKKRFLELGANNILVTGSMKFSDNHATIELKELKSKFNFYSQLPTVVFGSIREEEEDIITEIAFKIIAKGINIVVSPRHPERYEKFYQKLFDKGIILTRRTSNDEIVGDGMYLDTLGELADVYGLADVAFVGGSLGKVGGHNPFEAFDKCIPVVMGESTENFSEVVSPFRKLGFLKISNEPEKIEEFILNFLNDRGALNKDDLKKLVLQFKEATTKTLELIEPYLVDK